MLCALFIHNETRKSSVLIIDCVLHCSFVSLIAAGSSGELKHFISTDNKFYACILCIYNHTPWPWLLNTACINVTILI